MKHLLKMLDLTSIEIKEILNLADQLKYENQHGIKHHRLEGQSLGMIFQKSSTRTRVSFETGIGAGYRSGSLPVPGWDHDPHICPAGSGGFGALRFYSGNQRPDGFLPPLPGTGGSAHHSRI